MAKFEDILDDLEKRAEYGAEKDPSMPQEKPVVNTDDQPMTESKAMSGLHFGSEIPTDEALIEMIKADPEALKHYLLAVEKVVLKFKQMGKEKQQEIGSQADMTNMFNDPAMAQMGTNQESMQQPGAPQPGAVAPQDQNVAQGGPGAPGAPQPGAPVPEGAVPAEGAPVAPGAVPPEGAEEAPEDKGDKGRPPWLKKKKGDKKSDKKEVKKPAVDAKEQEKKSSANPLHDFLVETILHPKKK